MNRDRSGSRKPKFRGRDEDGRRRQEDQWVERVDLIEKTTEQSRDPYARRSPKNVPAAMIQSPSLRT